MRRGLWFVAGASAGVYAVSRARRAAEALTPDGFRDRLAGLALGAQLLRDEFTAGAADREVQVRERLGLLGDGPGQLTGEGASPRQLTQPQTDQPQTDQPQTTQQKDDD